MTKDVSLSEPPMVTTDQISSTQSNHAESSHTLASMVAQHSFELINSRQSIGALTEPAPSREQVELAIAAALTAPDHHRLQPWRFVVVEQPQLAAFGEFLADAVLADQTTTTSISEADISQKASEKIKQQPLRAPMVIVCLMRYQPHAKVPRYEQILSCGAAIQNLLLLLQAQGFASIWRTGDVAVSAHVKAGLGCDHYDEIAGLVYVGTAAKDIAPRQPVAVEQFVDYWQPST